MNIVRLGWLCLALAAVAQGQKTRNVIFVMTDGFRWQDAFRGADAALLNKENGVSEPDRVKAEFWRENPEARRQTLLPFIWTEIRRNGQIYGNRDRGSDAVVTNGLNFSYPGYSEAFCGFPDPRIDSNDKKPNPNENVLEWLNRKPAFAGKVAAFGAWDVFPYIFNVERSGLPVNAGYEPFTGLPGSALVESLNRLKKETDVLDGEALDAFPFHTALEYMRTKKPRVLYLSLGETDEWAHAGKYELYLHAALRVDRYVKELWETAQSMPEYRGSTTLILAVDHGRGTAPVEWRSHGEKLPESKFVWMAFLGPDTAALGEREKTGTITQSQIAATLAALLGEDYAGHQPKAGKPIADVVGPQRAKSAFNRP
jgi:type I phosphodiesterase/nucleotide pyrophosphatase